MFLYVSGGRVRLKKDCNFVIDNMVDWFLDEHIMKERGFCILLFCFVLLVR